MTDRRAAAFNRVGKRPTYTAEQTLQRNREGLAYISKQFVRYGLTSVHHEGGDLSALQQVRARGELLHRVSYEASGRVLEAMIAAGIKTGFGDEWIRFGATSEHTVDGSFSERTMALSTPYPGVTPPYKGNVTETQDELNAWVERVHRAGIQVNCHANGDVAIDMVLTAVERAQKLFPRADARPKITHCTLVNDDLVRRIKATGAVPAAFTTYAYYNPDKFEYLWRRADEALHGLSHFPRRRDCGGGGLGLQSGTVRAADGYSGNGHATGWDGKTWGANQRISVEEALRVNTHQRRLQLARGSDQGIHYAGQTGGLRRAVGRSLHGGQGENQGSQIVRTVVGGSTVYQA